MGDANASFERHARESGFHPHLISPVKLERAIYLPGFSRRDPTLKDVLRNCVRPFCAVQWREPDLRARCYPRVSFLGMPIREIKRDEKACVCVNQYRPRSSITRSAPGSTRSPKIFLARRANSGHFWASASDDSGTMRPRTRSRSRSSTVSPASSQAFSRRVSRN
jgi:hypothetical protein